MAKAVSNKKFKATVISLCAGFLVVVGALIGVWAASSQNLKAGFKVDYEIGANVAAEVRTEYIIQGDVAATTVTKNANDQVVNNSNGYIPFNAGDAEGTKEISLGRHDLDVKRQTMTIYFTIHSLMAQDYVQTSIVPTYSTKSNVIVSTSYYDSTSFAHSASATTIADSSFEALPSKHIPVGGYRIIKVTITVDNENIDALCAGNFTIGLYYSQTEGAVEVSTPTQLLSVMQTPGAMVELEQNIDLNDVTQVAVSSVGATPRANEIPLVSSLYQDHFGTGVYSIFGNYTGIIDGKGYKLTMPSAGKYLSGDDAYDYGYVFFEYNGTLKNIEIEYPNVTNQVVSLVYRTKAGVRFEGVTATGSIQCAETSTVGNYSPLISFIYPGADTSFVNCTNACNISGVKYGSAFVGGYIPAARSQTVDANGKYTNVSKGYVDGIRVEFINCVNEGILSMRDASMLWGNATHIPLPQNLIIRGCVNNGNIIGEQQAQLFCGLENDGSAKLVEFQIKDLPALNKVIAAQIAGSGTCAVMTALEGLELIEGANQELTLSAPAGNYSFKLLYNTRLKYQIDGVYKGTYSCLIIVDVTPGQMPYGRYELVDQTWIESNPNATMTEIDVSEGSGVSLSAPAQLFLVSLNGQNYFYIRPYDWESIDYYVGDALSVDTEVRDVYVNVYENGICVGVTIIQAD